MAQVTRLGMYGGPRSPYGSFAGKEEQVGVPSFFANNVLLVRFSSLVGLILLRLFTEL